MKINYSKFLPAQNTLRKPGVLFMIFTACFAFWFVDLWKPYSTPAGKNNFVWDVFGYYSYLPATFCNNGSFEWTGNNNSTGHNPVGPLKTHLPKYTYGMSVMYAPFFALGYIIAESQQSALDGFSEPFASSVRWGSIFYVLLGIFFLRKFLLFFFSMTFVVTAVLTMCLFGTTLFMNTFIQSEMTHGYLFCLFSVFLYLTYKWHHEQRFKFTILIAFILGLISLIRPTEIFIVLFFIFWNIKSIRDIKPKINFFLKNSIHLIVMLVVVILMWIPQSCCFIRRIPAFIFISHMEKKAFSGTILRSSIFLFSYRKGWITYTPVIILAFVGFFFVKKEFPLSKWLFFFSDCVNGVYSKLLVGLGIWRLFLVQGSFASILHTLQSRWRMQLILFSIPLKNLY